VLGSSCLGLASPRHQPASPRSRGLCLILCLCLMKNALTTSLLHRHIRLGLGLVIWLEIGINCIFGYGRPKPLRCSHNCRRTVTSRLSEYNRNLYASKTSTNTTAQRKLSTYHIVHAYKQSKRRRAVKTLALSVRTSLLTSTTRRSSSSPEHDGGGV